MTQQEALEAAKLAKVIGSQLGSIDKLMIDPSRSANQIDLNRFISQVVQPNNSANYQKNSSGYVPEELVQKLVPDISNNIQVEQSNIPNQSTKMQKKKFVDSQQESFVGIDDKNMKKIASSLERISKSYEKYVEYILINGNVKSVLND